MKDQIVKTAEVLFFSKGYNSVSLNSICSPLKIKPASLYYHFKGGKEEIYLEVIRLRTAEFKSQIESLALRHNDLETTLREFGRWYANQPPMNMMLIAQIDMPYLSQKGQRAVMESVRLSVFESLGLLFTRYRQSLKQEFDVYSLVGTLSVLLYSIHTAIKMSGKKPEDLSDYNISVFLRGVLKSD